MIFVQFYKESTGYVAGTIPPKFDEAHKRLIEACGDRGVLVIDDRLKSETVGAIAARECAARGFLAWRIFNGESFARSRPISGLWRVSNGANDKSAMSATWGA